MPFNALTNQMEPNYEDKISCVDGDVLFDFFCDIGAAPQWGTCNGKTVIKLLTLCHGGTHHKAYLDPERKIIYCFSGCPKKGVMVHTWVKRALKLKYAQQAKDLIENWLDGQGLDYDFEDGNAWEGAGNRQQRGKPFDLTQPIEMVQGIDPSIIAELYSRFDTTPQTLARLCWHHQDGIPVEQLVAFQVACYPEHSTIILPHHNANGEIVGLYERYFGPLRKEVKELYQEWNNIAGANVMVKADYDTIYATPKSKYMPLMRDKKYITEDKCCWSFRNSLNLYGLHRAKEAIRQTGKAIIFEGAKSVMLAHSYGYPFSVASHTYGASLNHIAMLIQAGAREIILAFDKQYKDFDGVEWVIYEMATTDFSQQFKGHVTISRIVDKSNMLQYKDAPIDQGKEIFESLYSNREVLTM